MNVVFLGGGSIRLLPLIRGIFSASPAVFQNGTIRLVDRETGRAEAVGKLIMACPEYAKVGCRVLWTDDLDSVLPGTDVVYLTMAARREPSQSESMFLGNRYGFVASDNLSVTGAFLSLRLGRTILNIARKMERHCPGALMLIFPNPVAVYSHLVNTHTRIRALGICGGFNNHKWDLSRLTGRDDFDPQWQVVAAGVNHLSFILRGTRAGRDLYSEIMPECLTQDWQPPAISGVSPQTEQCIRQALVWLTRLYRRCGTLVFSTEADGLGHLFRDDYLEWQRKTWGTGESFDPAEAARQEQQNAAANFQTLAEASRDPRKIDWSSETGLFRKQKTDITIPLFHALAGLGTMRITASRPNGNAVRGFAPDAPLEYTMDVSAAGIRPVEDLYVPEPFFGLIASMAEFQRLQAEAIAAWDPRIFADALEAYPVRQFERERSEFYCKMFEVFSDIDPEMRAARSFFG